jgi:MarR family transcriptional regulator, lower aerobic nicotinate degradation pathway regulator
MPAMEPSEAESGLVSALVRMSFEVQMILGRIAATYEVSVIQVRLLGILRDREPTMAALARFLMLDKSSITGLVDRAERRGLVRRAASPQDGRSVQVVITAPGRQLAEAFARDVDQAVGALVDGLTGAERRRLAALAERIAATGTASRGLD